MHEMQTIVTDDCGVCLSVCLLRGSTVSGAFDETSASCQERQKSTTVMFMHS